MFLVQLDVKLNRFSLYNFYTGETVNIMLLMYSKFYIRLLKATQ